MKHISLHVQKEGGFEIRGYEHLDLKFCTGMPNYNYTFPVIKLWFENSNREEFFSWLTEVIEMIRTSPIPFIVEPVSEYPALEYSVNIARYDYSTGDDGFEFTLLFRRLPENNRKYEIKSVDQCFPLIQEWFTNKNQEDLDSLAEALKLIS